MIDGGISRNKTKIKEVFRLLASLIDLHLTRPFFGITNSAQYPKDLHEGCVGCHIHAANDAAFKQTAACGISTHLDCSLQALGNIDDQLGLTSPFSPDRVVNAVQKRFGTISDSECLQYDS